MLHRTPAPPAAITPIRLAIEMSETGELCAPPISSTIAGDDCITSLNRSIRHVSRNSDADIVCLPWSSGCTRGAGPRRRKGAFNLTMRLYSPKSEALTGKWNPPPIVRTQGTVGLSAQ